MKKSTQKSQSKLLWSVLFVLIAAATIWAVLSQSKAFSLRSFAAYASGASKPWLAMALLSTLGFIVFEGEALVVICRLCGCFLDSGASKLLIRPFVRRHGIDLSEYAGGEFKSFNHFFSRKIKEGRRPVAPDPSALVAPCDGLLSAYRISGDAVIQTENFGSIIQMEVGAMLVGRIKNHHGPGNVRRGEEKGMFLYGGSTVIVLLEDGRARLPEELYQAAADRVETPVRMGQQIGRSANTPVNGGSSFRARRDGNI